MSDKAKIRHQISSVFHIILQNWSALLGFELIYKSFSYFLLSPFLQIVFLLFPKAVKKTWLGQAHLHYLFYAGGIFLAGFFLYFEIVSLFVYCEESFQKNPLTISSLFSKSRKKTFCLLKKGKRPVFFLLPVMAFCFFSLTGGYLQNVRALGMFFIYLKRRPPLLGLVLLAGAAFCIIFFFYFFGLPFLLFEDLSFSASWQESRRLLKERKATVLKSLLFFLSSFCVLLLTAATAIICILAAITRFNTALGPNRFRLYVSSLEDIWQMLAGSLFSVFLCSVIIFLFHRCKKDSQPSPIRSPLTPKLFLKRSGIILFALTLLLLVHETELSSPVPSSGNSSAKIVAHRAGAAAAPENTAAALELAIEAGTYMAEIDVQQLKDKTLIVMHDDNFKRTTGVNLPVWKADYEQIKNLDAGSSFSSAFAGEPVPTLEEMLKLAKDRIILMIELKHNGHEKNLVQDTLKLIEAYDMKNQCIIASMDSSLLNQVKRLDSHMETVYISSYLLFQQYSSGALDGYSIKSSSLSRSLVIQAHLQGKQIYSWTANSGKNIQKLLNCGVDGIITDDPELAQYHLDSITGGPFLNSLCDLFFPSEIEMGSKTERTDDRNAFSDTP